MMNDLGVGLESKEQCRAFLNESKEDIEEWLQIFQDTDVAFIHIPRAGSTSLEYGIFGSDKLPRRVSVAAEQLEARLSYGRFQEMYKIASVRNPWSRLVSAYEALRNIKNDGSALPEDVIGHQLIRKLGSFEALVDFLFKLHCHEELNDSRWPLPLPVLNTKIGQKFCPVQFRPQYTFVTDGDDNLLVDALFALERINDGISMLKSGAADTRNMGRRIDVPELPTLCQGVFDEIDYLYYYHDPWVVMKVSRIYAKDFRLFHYDGSGPPDEQCPRYTESLRRSKSLAYRAPTASKSDSEDETEEKADIRKSSN